MCYFFFFSETEWYFPCLKEAKSSHAWSWTDLKMNFLVQSRKTNPDPPCPQIRHVLSVGLGAISYGIAANRGNFILMHPVLVPEPQGRSQPLVLHKQEEESYRGGGDLLFTVCLSLKRYCQVFFPCYCTEFEKLERIICSQGQLQQLCRIRGLLESIWSGDLCCPGTAERRLSLSEANYSPCSSRAVP